MTMATIKISREDAEKIVLLAEGHFSEVKSKEVSPANLTKALSAFANSEGGDLYTGIDEVGPRKHRQWRGFDDAEAANGHIQAFEHLFPLGQDCVYEFLRCDAHPGLVLHLQVLKTKRIVPATNTIVYTRRGAQSLPLTGAEALRRLEFAKGLASFEAPRHLQAHGNAGHDQAHGRLRDQQHEVLQKAKASGPNKTNNTIASKKTPLALGALA